MDLFNFKFLSQSIILLIQFCAVGYMVVAIIIRYIYGEVENTSKRFLLPIIVLLTGVFMSSIIAHAYHRQPYVITFWAQSSMYWFVLYFYLIVNNYQKKTLENVLIIFALCYFTLFIIQYFAYPRLLFDIRVADDPDRGTIRIFITGYAILTAGFCLVLEKFLATNKIKYLIVSLLFMSIPILQATRQTIFVFILIVLYAVLFSKSVKSRSLIVLLISLSVIPFYFIFQDIIQNLLEITSDLEKDGSFNAREVAMAYFLNDFFPSPLAYILGNGADHMRSPYGLLIARLKMIGLYQSDIGLIGEYSKYGAIFIIGVFMIIYKLLVFKAKPGLAYIRYYALSLLLFIPLRPSFTNPSSIVVLCFLFYIIDTEYNKKNFED